MDKVTVSAKALHRVLTALNGPDHFIKELQVTRNPALGTTNPINILIDEYNDAVRQHHEGSKDHEPS